MKKQIIEIDSIPKPKFDMKYREVNVSLIKYITRMVRTTFEYKEYIQILKNYLNVDRCAYYEGYSIKNGFTLEVHHSPFTLFDICEIVCNKHFSLNNYIETFKVTEEVVLLHFEFKVGLVPLNPTAHQLVHSGSLVIHPELVLGSWKEFEEEYRSYMSEDMRLKYIDMIKYEKETDPSIFPTIMKKTDVVLKLPNVKPLTKLNLDKLFIEQKLKRLE
jgi:hypothetical protein